jgi:hypothetical protein
LWHGGSTYGADKAKWKIVKKSTRQASWERLYNRPSAAILCTSGGTSFQTLSTRGVEACGSACLEPVFLIVWDRVI